MSDLKTILEQADAAHNSDDFEEAVRLYKQAVMFDPNSHAMARLGYCQHYADINFARRLHRAHPDNLFVKMLLARELTHNVDGSIQAIDMYTELLADESIRDVMKNNIRGARLDAVLKTRHHYRLAVNDFVAMWNYEKITNKRYRVHLLKKIAEVTDHEALAFFDGLLKSTELPEYIKPFIQSKIDELEALSVVTEWL